MHVVDRMLMKSVEIKPVENMNRLSSNLITKKNKNTSLLEPVLNKTNNVIEEFTNDEKSKLEKFIFAFKPERKTENRLPENENLRDYNDMKINFLNLEKENYRLKQENIDLKGELEKEKTIINDLLKGDEDKLEILHKNDLSLAEKRLEELKKENDRLLEEKYLLENSVLSQKKANEEINAKLTIQIDENSMLRKQTANLNEFLNKKEKQMKTLIEEINRGKQEGAAESFVDKTDRLKIIEEELKKQDVDMGNLKKNLQEKIALLQETKGNLEKSNNEANSQKKEIQQFKEQVANLEKISEINNERLKEMEDLRGNYLRSKQNLADIINLVFFSGTNELIEEVDKILTVDIN